MNRIALVVVVAILLCCWAVGSRQFYGAGAEYAAAGKAVWLEQNWTAQQRDWFYHTEQGTQTFGIRTSGSLRWSSRRCRWASRECSAIRSTSIDMDLFRRKQKPASGAADRVRGRAEIGGGESADKCADDCAGIDLRGLPHRAVHVSGDGGAGRWGAGADELSKFQKAMALSLLYTAYVPTRFDRFSERGWERMRIASQIGAAKAVR